MAVSKKAQSHDWKQYAKMAGVAVLVVIALTILLRMLAVPVQTVLQGTGLNVLNDGYGYASKSVAPSMSVGGYAQSEAAFDSVDLSIRNIAPTPVPQPPYEPGGTTGDDAEEYEVRDYSVTIETRDAEKTCAEIEKLKPLDYVIFENANEYDRGCDYRFKVAVKNVNEVLSVIESLDPKDINENVQTIKQLVEDYTSREEILETKLVTIDETLKNAVNAYDELSTLATSAQDVESLTNIIDSKLRIIERLTQERITISAQLEQLQRSKALQLDRLEYTYFSVYVYENKFVDGENLKDSWKRAVQEFVSDINQLAQDITVNLIVMVLYVLLYVAYILLIVVVAKKVWQWVKYIWNK